MIDNYGLSWILAGRFSLLFFEVSHSLGVEQDLNCTRQTYSQTAFHGVRSHLKDWIPFFLYRNVVQNMTPSQQNCRQSA